MHAQLEQDLSLKDLAAASYLSPFHFARLFKKLTGATPHNYLAAIRLVHAAYLFESAGLSVADVSYRLEYSSPQSFGRHLRAMLGLTALEFRHRFPFSVALRRFIELMVIPYRSIWAAFHPVAAGGWDAGGS